MILPLGKAQVKDIVTASPHFDVAAFIPKLRDYLRVVNPNKRQVRIHRTHAYSQVTYFSHGHILALQPCYMCNPLVFDAPTPTRICHVPASYIQASDTAGCLDLPDLYRCMISRVNVPRTPHIAFHTTVHRPRTLHTFIHIIMQYCLN